MRSVSQRSRSWRRGLWLACCIVLAASGCSYPEPATEAAEACAAYAAQTCQTLQRCGNALLAPYGSLEDCRAQLGASCSFGLLQPDVGSTSSGVRLCGAWMAIVDCTDLLNGELPAACGLARASAAKVPSAAWERSAPAGAAPGGEQAAGAAAASSPGPAGVQQLRRLPGGLGMHGRPVQQARCSGRCVQRAYAMSGSVDVCRRPLRPECECGSCDAGSCQDDAGTPAAACRALAQALCTRLTACAPSLVASLYGDTTTCATRAAAACLTRQQTPDVVSSAAGLAACTQLLASSECAALLDNALRLPASSQRARAPQGGRAATTRSARPPAARAPRTPPAVFARHSQARRPGAARTAIARPDSCVAWTRCVARRARSARAAINGSAARLG
jgi:hypothetical protein